MYNRLDTKENQQMTHERIMVVFQVVFSDSKSLDSKKLTLKKLKGTVQRDGSGRN